MGTDHTSPPSDSPDPHVTPEDPNDVILIDTWDLTRATFRHAPVALGDAPLELDTIVTLGGRFVIEDVTIRPRVPSEFEILWPGLLSVTVDGVRLDGDITSRARSRVGTALVQILVESDLGAELP